MFGERQIGKVQADGVRLCSGPIRCTKSNKVEIYLRDDQVGGWPKTEIFHLDMRSGGQIGDFLFPPVTFAVSADYPSKDIICHVLAWSMEDGVHQNEMPQVQ